MYFLKRKYSEKPFKIRSKDTAKEFLTDVFNGETHVIIASDCAIGIYHKRGTEPYVTIKNGDIYDPFNPEFALTFERSVDYIYTIRKYINARVLGDC